MVVGVEEGADSERGVLALLRSQGPLGDHEKHYMDRMEVARHLILHVCIALQ